MKMFKTSALSVLVLAAMSLGTFQTQQAMAQTGVTPVGIAPDIRHNLAERILQRCAHRIKRLAVACADSNAAISNRCVNVIRMLLANGQDVLARRVARFCLQLVNSRTDRCIRAIQTLCRRCHLAMAAAGATQAQLLDLRMLCARAIDHVEASRQNCIDDIRSLF